jgi:DNA-directed RNA polymerase specialized sigma24 family protein
MLTIDTPGVSCNVGAMTTEHEPRELPELLVYRGERLARAVGRLENERAAMRSVVVRAVAAGIPQTEVAKLSGVARKTVREWTRPT